MHREALRIPENAYEKVMHTNQEYRPLAQPSNFTQELTSTQVKSTEVILRFGLRMIVLIIFAAFGGAGFDRSLTALLWMSAILSTVLASLEQDGPFDAVLNNWDEAMAYAALCCLVSGFDPAVHI
jgi:hypothetical protein